MPHTPEPWYVHEFRAENFPFAICTNPDPDTVYNAIALITRECRKKPIECTREEIRANAELLVRAPRMARLLERMAYHYGDLLRIAGRANMTAPSRDESLALLEELKKAGAL